MDKKKKGLADTNEGEFILNESGSTINTDNTNSVDEEINPAAEPERAPSEPDRSLLEKYGFEKDSKQ